MQNKSFAASLQYSTHFLSPGGDLRAQYVPWGNPPSGNLGYSYLKCEATVDSTYVELVMQNLDDTGKNNAVATLSVATIKEDAALYSRPQDNPADPYLTPPVWSAPSIGTGGVVTVVPGGKYRGGFSIATGSGYPTAVVRVHLTGAPLKVEAYTTGFCEEY